MEIKTKFDVGDKAFTQNFYGDIVAIEIKGIKIEIRENPSDGLNVSETYEVARNGSDVLVEVRADEIIAARSEIAKNEIEIKRKLIKELEAQIEELEDWK